MYNSNVYLQEKTMHRTQIYFEEQFFESVKKKAKELNISVSAYIRDTIKKDLESQNSIQEPINLSTFSGQWKDYDISIKSIREKAWK